MGLRGPVPKPTATRRRVNKPAIPVKKAKSGRTAAPAGKPAPKTRKTKAGVTPEAVASKPNESIPKPNAKWHPIAKSIFTALVESGQSEFYEASDWTIAFLVCESISRDLSPQVVGVTPSGQILRDVIPMKGASLSAYMKSFTDLLMTEGARRRASVELQRGPQIDPDADAARALITDIATERLRVAG